VSTSPGKGAYPNPTRRQSAAATVSSKMRLASSVVTALCRRACCPQGFPDRLGGRGAPSRRLALARATERAGGVTPAGRRRWIIPSVSCFQVVSSAENDILKSMTTTLGRLLVCSLPLLLLAGIGNAGQLVITNVTVNSNTVNLGWSSTTDRYIVARSSNLTAGSFQYVGAVLSTNEAALTNNLPLGFFRVRQVTVVDFPDPNLRHVVTNAIVNWFEPRSEVYDIELSGIKNIYAEWAAITNTAGIGSLNELTNLNITHNQLASLDVSGCTNLQTLLCADNRLTNLDVSGCGNLLHLYCPLNNLTDLDVSGCDNLQTLYCSSNSLENLDLSGCHHLQELECGLNLLTNLNILGCSTLEYLFCEVNQLTNLEVSGCTNLRTLWCFDNRITDLSSLVSNAAAGGLGTNDVVWFSGNPLSSFAQTNQIPYLQSKGVNVTWP
jgi:Leucine-rich repeat (LRR) protein